MMKKFFQLLAISFVFFALTNSLELIENYGNGKADDATGSDMFGKLTKEIIKMRGYEAQDFNITINPGTTINLVRIINPLMMKSANNNDSDSNNNNNSSVEIKQSILFLHGMLASSNYFIINSINARPSDWRSLDLLGSNAKQLTELLAKDPTSKCLPMLMANFGYDVWLLNRRPTIESQTASDWPTNFEKFTNSSLIGKTKLFIQLKAAILRFMLKPKRSIISFLRTLTGLTLWRQELYLNEFGYDLDTILRPHLAQKIINPNYWNFSLDDQAREDLPIVIDFILEKTNRSKLDIAGHSLGGALPLMTMILRPEYQPKIDQLFLFAPAVDLGKTKWPTHTLAKLINIVYNLVSGPSPPGILSPLMQTTLANICNTKEANHYLCAQVLNGAVGIGSDQLDLFAGFYYSCLTTVSTHEIVQIVQSIKRRHLHRYDYGTKKRNMIAYNQSESPIYEMDQIKDARISIWVGNTDIRVTPETTKILVDSLKMPVNLTVLGTSDQKFNHLSYQYHYNVHKMINIPIMQSLQRVHSNQETTISKLTD